MTNSVSCVNFCKYINMMGLEAPPPSQSFEGNSVRSSGFFGGALEILFLLIKKTHQES